MWRWLTLCILLLTIGAYAVIRDIQFDKAFPGDLRNRVTGARLVKDGRVPYFYKWKPGDGLRYYDPENFNRAGASNMSSTPVLYHLLSPLVEWPQATISRIWLGIEYGMLIVLTLFSLSRAPTIAGKQAVLLVMGLILLSNPWKSHVSLGQTYLCIPFFAMLFLFFGEKDRHWLAAFAAGIAASCLVLIRPNAVLFFVPFLFLIPRYSRTWLLCFSIPIVLFACWIFGNTHERELWRDYSSYVTRAMRTEQQLLTDNVPNAADPGYPVWEGLDTMVYHQNSAHPPARVYSENGNVFVLYENIVHRKMPIWMMAALSLLLITSFVVFFCLRGLPLKKKDSYRAALMGFSLLMIPDLFSPVHRHQYYTVQWILPLMLAAGRVNARQKVFYYLLLAGLLLNCFHLPFLKMQNTIGEYLFLVVLFLMAADPDSVNEKILS